MWVLVIRTQLDIEVESSWTLLSSLQGVSQGPSSALGRCRDTVPPAEGRISTRALTDTGARTVAALSSLADGGSFPVRAMTCREVWKQPPWGGNGGEQRYGGGPNRQNDLVLWSAKSCTFLWCFCSLRTWDLI